MSLNIFSRAYVASVYPFNEVPVHVVFLARKWSAAFKQLRFKSSYG